MRNITLIGMIIALTSLFVNAQGPISFESDSMGAVESVIVGDVILNNKIINNTNDSIVIKWVKHNEVFDDNWSGVAVCVIECYVPSFNSRLETIPADTFYRFDVHFLADGYPGEGVADAYVFVVGDSANTVIRSKYYGKAEFETSVNSGNLLNNTIDIKVYPNPATNYLMFNNLPTSKDVTIEAYSILGKKMVSAKVNVADNPLGTGEYRLDLETLPKGIYMIRVYDEHMNVIHSESISRVKS